MSRKNSLLFLGILTIVLPFLGFPNNWKKIFFIIIGLCVIWISRKISEGTSISLSFKENKTSSNNFKKSGSEFTKETTQEFVAESGNEDQGNHVETVSIQNPVQSTVQDTSILKTKPLKKSIYSRIPKRQTKPAIRIRGKELYSDKITSHDLEFATTANQENTYEN